MRGSDIERSITVAHRTKFITVAALAAFLTHRGTAEAAGDVASGQTLAKAWCAGCHVVVPNGLGGDAGPPFAAVAARPNGSAAGLRAWLTDPHPPMPNLGLSRQQIEDIVAYLESLKRP
jgi:mono/diheme cytochrome c family protein